MSENSEVVIRPMQAEDAATVAQMARELAASVADPEPVLDASDLVRDGLGTERWFECLVALAAGTVVGYAMTCRRYEAHTGKRHLWLSDLYVRKQARGKGVGRALMTAVARRAIEQGCDTVCWDLWRHNHAGKSFYERLSATEVTDVAVWRVSSGTLSPRARG